MIPLPPGCKRGYEIRFMVEELSDAMGEWFNMIGGTATRVQWYDSRGREKFTNQVQYGKAKSSYKMQDGTGLTLIRFSGEDASTASMFLIKFLDQIKQHNFKEYEQYD